ncbi:MAG TPA: hypothetical protein VKU84_01820 [Stellaceae bacterium]|nr:hypothetical protein [Stellaceae bacterium]
MKADAKPRVLTAAERQRHRRRRMRDGTKRLLVDISPGVVTALIAEGLLGQSEADDPQRLGDTIADVLECWSEGRLSSRLLRHAVTGHRFLNPRDTSGASESSPKEIGDEHEQQPD